MSFQAEEYREGFEHERRDRERALQQVDNYKSNLGMMQQQGRVNDALWQASPKESYCPLPLCAYVRMCICMCR